MHPTHATAPTAERQPLRAAAAGSPAPRCCPDKVALAIEKPNPTTKPHHQQTLADAVGGERPRCRSNGLMSIKKPK